MKYFILTFSVSILVTFANAQTTQPLVCLDKVFIQYDSIEVVNNLGLERIKSYSFLNADTAQSLIGEYGRFGIIFLESVEPDDSIVSKIRNYQFKPEKAELNLIVNGETKETSYMQKLNPHEIKSIKVLRPLDAVIEFGVEMINGIIIIETK
ncbi:MAG: hypothetical protein RIC35_18080 [Marinoscillum sp.]